MKFDSRPDRVLLAGPVGGPTRISSCGLRLLQFNIFYYGQDVPAFGFDARRSFTGGGGPLESESAALAAGFLCGPEKIELRPNSAWVRWAINRGGNCGLAIPGPFSFLAVALLLAALGLRRRILHRADQRA